MERLLTGIGITSQVTLNKVGYHVVPRDAAVLVGLGRGAPHSRSGGAIAPETYAGRIALRLHISRFTEVVVLFILSNTWQPGRQSGQ